MNSFPELCRNYTSSVQRYSVIDIFLFFTRSVVHTPSRKLLYDISYHKRSRMRFLRTLDARKWRTVCQFYFAPTLKQDFCPFFPRWAWQPSVYYRKYWLSCLFYHSGYPIPTFCLICASCCMLFTWKFFGRSTGSVAFPSFFVRSLLRHVLLFYLTDVLLVLGDCMDQ